MRHPAATRPWQHVLEPLGGYLWLAARLRAIAAPGPFATAFNFGPAPAATQPVSVLVEEVLKHWPGRWEDRSDPQAVHEAALLSLAIGKAERVLGWKPVWDFAATITHTIEWYRTVSADASLAAVHTRRQIAAYEATARTLKLSWTHE